MREDYLDRSYQVAAVHGIDAAIDRGAKAPLLVLPTGGGKTRIATYVIGRAADAGKRAWFLAPRRELVTQASRTLNRAGIGHGVIMADADGGGGLYSQVQVASIDTLLSRIRRNRIQLPEPNLVVVDEAHLSITEIRAELLNLWPNAIRVGLTATPTRRDGRALGILYDTLIEPTTVAELQQQGYLCKARYFSISEPDLTRVGLVAGDYNQGQLEQAVNQPKLVGDVVAHWLRHAPTRRTVVFATSIKHSAALTEEFLRNGVAAEHVDANTPQEIRDAIFERFSQGKTQVLTNCFLASYGFDLPELDCVVLARPTKSLMLYLQMIGRGLRIAEGKSDCLVLDHSGAVRQHGFAHDERVWTLQGKNALVKHERAAGERKEPEMLTCPECQCVFSGARLCPECGYFFAPVGKSVQTLVGELVELGSTVKRIDEDRRKWYAEMRGLCAEKGWKAGAAAHRFKEKFGTFPPFAWNNEPVVTPSIETRRWAKSRAIAWVKSQQHNRSAQ